ncbi:MAG: PqqD family protein [Smithella sp.]
MLDIDQGERYKLKEEYVLHQIPDLNQYWLFNILNGEHYSLNEVSMFILQSLREGSTCDELAQRVLENYEVSNGEALDDVKEILAELLREKIIITDRGE